MFRSVRALFARASAAAIRPGVAGAPQARLRMPRRAVLASALLVGVASTAPALAAEERLSNDELQDLHSAYGMLALLVCGPRYGQTPIAGQAKELRAAFRDAADGRDEMDADAFCDFVGAQLGAPLTDAERTTWLHALGQGSATSTVSQQDFVQAFLLIRGMGAQHAARQLPMHFAVIDADQDGRATKEDLGRWLRLAVRTEYVAPTQAPVERLLEHHGVQQSSLSLGEFQAVFQGLVLEDKALASTRQA